jgi:hypothetical protein
MTTLVYVLTILGFIVTGIVLLSALIVSLFLHTAYKVSIGIERKSMTTAGVGFLNHGTLLHRQQQ